LDASQIGATANVIIKVELDLVVGRQRNSGRIYSLSTLQEAIDDIEYPLLVDTVSNETNVVLSSVCGSISKIEIKDDKLTAIFTPMEDSPMGQIMYNSLTDAAMLPEFAIAGTGVVEESGEVGNFTICKVYINNKK
jgi:hypothetical protein